MDFLGIFKLITGNWQLIAMGVLLAALAGSAGYIKILSSEKATLVAEKATLTTQLTESQANLIQLKNDISAQNTAIDNLKADAEKRQSQSEVEIKKAQATANSFKKQAADLLKRTAPQNVSSCDAANMLINEEVKNAHK